MEPKCPSCEGSEFGTKYVDNQIAYIVYCTTCGHILGVMPDHVEFAKTVAQFLTSGTKDGFGHPVLHVNQVQQTFG